MKLSQWLNRKNRAEENRFIKIVRNSELFDERWYASEYQDVFKKLKDPARHYYQKGWLENRNPSENFSTAEYLRKHSECNICPLVFEHNRNGYVDLSVCAIIKNEAPYMEEWLDYHLSVGVKRFYIYDNGSTDNLTEILEPYISKGLVVYKYYPGAAKQMSAYNDCIKVSKDKTEWLAVIDADEFIMPVKKNGIPEFLKEFKDCPGVGINWICYDSNGYKNKPEGGVLENYTRVHYDEQFSTNHHIKSIVRPAMVDKYITPYYAQYTEGKNAVDENGNEIKGCVYRDVHPKAYTDVVSVNKIRINHYYSKSEEEYKAKLERSRALIKDAKKQFSQRSLMFDDVKYDYTAYKFVERLYPELEQRLEIKARWFKVKNMFIGLKHVGEPSTLFDYIDEKWYFEQYPEAKKSKMTALQHYLSTGWKEGKNPSRYFDTNFYLSRYSDIAEAGINPLIHYLNAGKSAGRLPKIENSLSSDNTEQLRILVSKIDKKSKDYQILDNSELFDKEWYVNTYIKGQDIDPVAHYLCLGWKNGCNPSRSFDTDFYLQKYKDIAKSGQNPLLHYIKHGKEEGRYPKFNGCLFKRLWKRFRGTEYEDDVVISPHKITDEYKIVEKSKLFDQKWYARKYLQGQKINPIEHYLTIGWKEGSNPNSKYSTTEYLKQYPECGVCPLVFEHNRNGYVDLSICAIMKNEAPYVKEWIDYHTLVGVKRFYIYDNESTDNLKEVLTPYIAKGVVVYKYCTGESMQMPVYNECLEEYRDKNEWMAFINVDEFIVPVEKESVPEFLADYKEYPGVEVNWVNYDSNGYVTKPKGGVLENYLRRQYEIQSLKNHRGKSIVQPAECIKMKSHVGRYADGKSAVTENKEETYSRDFTDFVSVNKIRLNHYYCKSKEEAAEKISKGNVANADSAKRINPQDLNFPQYIYDCTIFKYLERLNPEKSGKYSRKRTICGIKNAFIRLKHLFNKDLIEDYVDEKWYFAKYPEAKASGLSALKHYLTIGWKLGYNPSELFDTEYYLRRYPDIAKTGHNPLLHYITYGKNAGRLAKAEPVLLAQKPQEQPEIEASELKQQKQAKTENVEAKQQASTATNAKKTDYEIIESSGLFDKEYYLKHNPDVKDDPIRHYLKYGWKEHRECTPFFDGNRYLKLYPDVVKKDISPLLHWLLYGKKEGRLSMIVTPNKNRRDDCFFSVIVASYNYQDYISETLDSLVAQTYKNFEVIVVDDGSTDKSVKIIKKYAQKYPFIKLYQHKRGENKGLPETIALGISEAKGEYIAFCDSDDYWTPDHLEEINEKIVSEKLCQIVVNDVIAFGDERKFAEMEKVISYRKKAIIDQKGVFTDEQFSSCNYILTFSTCCVHKSLFNICDILNVPDKSNLDWWMWRQICFQNRIFYIDKKLTYWRLHSTQLENEQNNSVEFIEKLNQIMAKRKYDSVYNNNGKLSDINQFQILEIKARRKLLIEKIKNGDFSGIKICYVSTTGQGARPIGDGSVRYRCYHPAETLSAKGAFVTIVPHSVFLKSLSYHYDIYIFHRPCKAEIPIIKALKNIGKVLIADYDDLIFGNQEVAMQSSIYKNLNKPLESVTQQFLDNMSALLQFDYISLSTEGLKNELQDIYNAAKISVVHNFIPESILRLSDKLKVREMPKDKNLLMYCTGTLSHNCDFLEVEDVLLSCLDKDKDLKLLIFGVLAAPAKFQKSSRVFFHNVVDYWNLFESMSPAAFTMAPLEKSRFNECKSNVKFLESSVAGATLLATPIGDMKRIENSAIQLCATDADWENVILNRHAIDINKNIKTDYDYLIQNCSVDTFMTEFTQIFKNMEA